MGWPVLLATSTGKGSISHQRTKWSDNITGFAWPRLGMEPTELSEISVDRKVFRVVLLSRNTLQRKSWYESEWMNKRIKSLKFRVIYIFFFFEQKVHKCILLLTCLHCLCTANGSSVMTKSDKDLVFRATIVAFYPWRIHTIFQRFAQHSFQLAHQTPPLVIAWLWLAEPPIFLAHQTPPLVIACDAVNFMIF